MSDTPPPPPPSGPPPPPPSPQYGGGVPAAGPEQYAHWGKRVAGYLIDVVVMLPGIIVYSIGVAGMDPGDGLPFLAVIGILIMIGIGLWNIVFRQGTTGQTVGKSVVGAKLVAESTRQPLGPGLTFVRQLAHIVDGLICYIGYLFPLWDAKRQTIADKIMSSVVLDLQK